jgi:hypothetical protein
LIDIRRDLVNSILKGIGTIIGILILVGMFGHHDASIPAAETSGSDANTKIAYTQDGKNFVSKERVEENIKYGYANDGDYKEARVPLSTVVVGASVIPTETTERVAPSQKQSSVSKPTTKTTPTSTSEDKYILINYDGHLVDKLGYSNPDPGRAYLVMKIDIENHGYSGIGTNPYKFKVEADNIEHDISSATYIGLSNAGYPRLEDVTLKSGGKTSGYLVFEVPKETSRYSLTYSHWWENVRYN